MGWIGSIATSSQMDGNSGLLIWQETGTLFSSAIVRPHCGFGCVLSTLLRVRHTHLSGLNRDTTKLQMQGVFGLSTTSILATPNRRIVYSFQCIGDTNQLYRRTAATGQCYVYSTSNHFRLSIILNFYCCVNKDTKIQRGAKIQAKDLLWYAPHIPAPMTISCWKIRISFAINLDYLLCLAITSTESSCQSLRLI